MVARRVVITARGAVTPLGSHCSASMDALWQGRSALGPITEVDFSAYQFKSGGQVSDVAIEDGDRGGSFAAAAVAEVLAAAGLDDGSGVALALGSNFGSPQQVEEAAGGDLHYSAVLAKLRARYGFDVALSNPSLSCSTGAAAIGWAYDYVRRGHGMLALAGGYEGLSHFAWSGLSLLRTMSPDSLRPFDLNRSGTLFAEGAAVLVLEELEHARQRGATILAEIIGWGSSNNAHHMTAPSSDGAGLARAMQLALDRAAVEGAAVDAVNSHGTGTKYNDLSESTAIAAVCGEAALVANKGSFGHMMGAAGAVEAAASVESFLRDSLPPTANHREADSELNVDLVVDAPRDWQGEYLLSNSSGIGGNNVSLLFKRYAP